MRNFLSQPRSVIPILEWAPYRFVQLSAFSHNLWDICCASLAMKNASTYLCFFSDEMENMLMFLCIVIVAALFSVDTGKDAELARSVTFFLFLVAGAKIKFGSMAGTIFSQSHG